VFAPARHPGPALSLTASDGTGLRLVSLRARSVVNDPLAFTELHLAFENPQPRVLEGTFRLVVPPGASVSRVAMKIDERWQEGEVVEKQAARQAYEDFLHRRQDPALLEQAAGNEFSARVFPIPAHGVKELVISYAQELGRRSEPFRLPLGGLPRVERIEAEVYGAGGDLLGAFRQEKAQPEGDFLVELAQEDRHPGLRSGELVVARVEPVAGEQADLPGATLLLVDTSASRALGFPDQVKLVEGLARRIAQQSGGNTPLGVLAFDQDREWIYEGPASGLGDEALGRLRARGALGASGLSAALRDATASSREKGWKRVVLIGDGIATAGETESPALREQAAALRGAGVERLDAVALGGIREDTLLRGLTASPERGGIVADGAQPLDAIWRRLATRAHTLAIQVEGARWWHPTRLEGVQSGDEALVYAEVPPSQPTVRVTLGGRSVALTPASAERPLLARAAAQARIEMLLASGTTREVGPQVIELATRHRLVTPLTALLVLETEQDYERHKIQRDALADILTVRGGKLSVEGRRNPPEPLGFPAPEQETRSGDAAEQQVAGGPTPVTSAPATLQAPPPPVALPPPARTASPPPVTHAPPLPPPPPPPAADAPPPVGNMWGNGPGDASQGGLGLSGLGEGGGGLGQGIGLGQAGTIGHGAGTGIGQGFGSGLGRLGGQHRTNAPQVRMGATTVSGRLPPEVIQRIVRQNFGRLRMCYENGLRKIPNLRGRVAVRFVIGKQGDVTIAASGNSDLPDPATVNCVVNAFRTLRFPAPEGGIVTVLYPISFAPPGESLPSTSKPERPGPEKPAQVTPYPGEFGEIMGQLRKDPKEALARALAWRSREPGNVLALLALGEAHEQLGARASAARAYGSLIDLFPARADLRRHAASRLERLGSEALPLAIDTLRKAREQRPDHPSSHRMLGMALLRAGSHEEAFQVIAEGLKRGYPSGRFAGYDRILREDLGLIAAAWKKASPGQAMEVERRLKEAGGIPENGPSLRFVLAWETDANDVDFHIYDDQGNHAFFDRMKLASGGELYADVTTGYGPECFTIRKPAKQRRDYTLRAHYYARGPMGYGMGKLEIIEHDGQGNLTFEERPFLAMEDRAYVDLGEVKGKR
jgi:hypothetical protein